MLPPKDNPDFGANFVAPTTEYPGGSNKNSTNPDLKDGSPYALSVADQDLAWGHWPIYEAGIIPSGIKDDVIDSDHANGLRMLGIFPYSAKPDYRVGDSCRGSDNILYRAAAVNGPATAPVDPVGDQTGVWEAVVVKQTPFSNMLYGGSEAISQRGALTNLGATQYTLDGVQLKVEGAPAGRVDVSSVDVSSATGFSRIMRVTVSTPNAAPAAGELVVLRFPVEGQDIQHARFGVGTAKKLGVRIFLSADITGTFSIPFYLPATGEHFIKELVVTGAPTFQEHAFDLPPNIASAIINDNTAGLWMGFPLLVGSNWQGAAGAWTAGEKYGTATVPNLMVGAPTYHIAAKLEVGDSTSFEHPTFASALARAKRYYWQLDGVARLSAAAASANSFDFIVDHGEMRTIPTFGSSAIAGTNFQIVNGGTPTNITALAELGYGIKRSAVRATATGAGAASDNALFLLQGPAVNINFKAEM